MDIFKTEGNYVGLVEIYWIHFLTRRAENWLHVCRVIESLVL